MAVKFKSTKQTASYGAPKAPPKPAARPASPAQPAPVSYAPVEPAPPPPDPYYDAAVASAQRDYNQLMQQATYRMGQLGPTYGLGVNAQGGVFDDPSNPFSRAAALHQSYKNREQGNNTNYAARGQLYAGSYQNAIQDSAQQNNASRDSLIRSFLAARQSIADAQTNAHNVLLDRLAKAQSDSVAWSLGQRPDAASVPQAMPNLPPAAVPATGPKPAPKPKATAKPKAPSSKKPTAGFKSVSQKARYK